MIPNKFKKNCAACGAAGPFNKEHFWPKWLIDRTRTHRTTVRFSPTKFINPRSLVVPLCIKCNSDFGREIEAPVSRIFSDLETGQGITDREAELLIRWLWKFEGLSWVFSHPEDRYAEKHSLRERVLQPIDGIRSELSIAVSLTEEIDPTFGDAPMGLDSWNEHDAVFVAGVFSKVAMMVLRRQFEPDVPNQFSLYQLADPNAPDREAKLFYPKTGFKTCVEAVNTTRTVGLYLSHAHDLEARNQSIQYVQIQSKLAWMPR